MSTRDVLADFRSALRVPGVEKSGNILADELRRRADRYIVNDRAALVGAVREWLDARDELLTVQAAILAREFSLAELRDVIQHIRDEVAAGTALRPSYLWLFDKALKQIER
jgi:hypothetical protein